MLYNRYTDILVQLKEIEKEFQKDEYETTSVWKMPDSLEYAYMTSGR
jgi:hypothetical protein